MRPESCFAVFMGSPSNTNGYLSLNCQDRLFNVDTARGGFLHKRLTLSN